MKFPFVSRDRYDQMVTDKDRRIAALETERRLHLNTLTEIGFGIKLFPEEGVNQQAAVPENPDLLIAKAEQEQVQTMARLRPSQVVRKEQLRADREYQERQESQRKAQVMAMIREAAGGETN